MIRCWMVFQLRAGRFEVHPPFFVRARCLPSPSTDEPNGHAPRLDECILPRDHPGQRIFGSHESTGHNPQVRNCIWQGSEFECRRGAD